MGCTLRAVWSLVGAAACLGAMVNAAGILDVGIIFPRNNETYEPAEEFPIVWAFQNARLAEHLQPSLKYRLVNLSNPGAEHLALDKFQRNLNLSDFTDKESGLVLYWTHVKLDGEGRVGMGWEASWAECQNISLRDLDAGTRFSVNRTTTLIVDFDLKKGGKKADLVAATAANGQECPDQGFALRVTDKTNDVRERPQWAKPEDKCAVVDSSPPTPTANPCRVKLDKAAVESMEATTFKTKCSGPLDKPANCPKKDHAVRQFAGVGVAALSAAVGALYFLSA
ncbi:hypothetical protein MAPG_05308 [Magnaporthiopsis poae ATCC 64411]|uniref:DUF7136 domain-containing protein n=1 Tax=Magnaporthiopsis poae (strain ATCC 64411 / 73-15) TaxID=644358 RepID=A0A0C4DZ19_MAGP6|nr:hypothetical protein MAPG_05308 [Magnaporthiopsis poae ATCC 64411]